MNARLPIVSSRTRRYDEKREAILAAAARVFNEAGVKGATLAGIAKRVGLAQNSVTYYYRKKEDIAGACFLRSIEAHRSLVNACDMDESVETRIGKLFLRHAQMHASIERGETPPLVRFDELRTLPETLSGPVFDAYTQLFREFRHVFAGAHVRHLSRSELNARSHFLFSIMLWQPALLKRRETAEYALVAGQVADLALHGLAGAGRGWACPDAGFGWPLRPPLLTTPEAYLRAATELINEQGYKGASIDRIAARLNLTKGSFYHHHETKDDVVADCFERSFGVTGKALSLSDEVPGQAWEKLCAFASELVRCQMRDGVLLRITALSALPDQTQIARVSMALSRVIERIGDRVVEGLRDGSLRPLHPALAASMMFAGINAAAELHRWVKGVDESNVASLYVRSLMLGVLAA